MTRIFTDQPRSLNKQQTDRHRDVNNTSSSTSSKRVSRNAKKHGSGPRMV